jgi:hypothetical protein
MNSRRFRIHAAVLAAFGIAGAALLAPVDERKTLDHEPSTGGLLDAAFAKALVASSADPVRGIGARAGHTPAAAVVEKRRPGDGATRMGSCVAAAQSVKCEH